MKVMSAVCCRSPEWKVKVKVEQQRGQRSAASAVSCRDSEQHPGLLRRMWTSFLARTRTRSTGETGEGGKEEVGEVKELVEVEEEEEALDDASPPRKP